jgi:hypothetical protein
MPLRSKRRSPGRQSQPRRRLTTRRLVAGGDKQIEMIRAQRPVSHHPNAQRRVPLLQGEAAEKVRLVHD